jgi:type I restriction enzyme R subunit
MATAERQLEDAFIEKLRSLKYTLRPDITDRATLEKNFREKFEALNRVRLTDAEFARLLSEGYADNTNPCSPSACSTVYIWN